VSSRLYDRITTASVILAIISALLFERLGRWGWVAGVVGILAATAAAVTYFCNQSHTQKSGLSKFKEDGPAANAPEANASQTTPQEINAFVSGVDMYLDKWSQFACEVKDVKFANLVVTDPPFDHVVKSGGIFKNYMVALYSQLDVTPRASDLFAERVVEIVDRLCSQQKDLEFELTPEGSFLIRQIKRSPRALATSRETQTETPALLFPEKVQ
jgi:hypothetical protein